MRIEPYDGPTAPESVLRDVHALWDAEWADLHTEEPPFTWEELRGLLRMPTERFKKLRWLARDDGGEPIARLDLQLPTAGANEQLGFVELYVVREARKQGVGTALVTTALDALEQHGRTRVRVSIVEGSPGDAFCSAFGGVIGRANRKSRMHLEALDRSMLREWIERAEAGAEGYSLRWFDVASLDADDLSEYVGIRALMNTAPRGDLEDEPWVHTPETTLEEAAELVAEGVERWTLVAVEDATGVFAGFTELMFAESAPEHSWQGGTAVRVEHRNHGLGRWLKATMAERAMAERPLVRVVDTENAYSNEPMLNINVAMGFEIIKTVNDWQVPVAAIRSALEAQPCARETQP
jgi:GNAT superfamily N-acetyltransferase